MLIVGKCPALLHENCSVLIICRFMTVLDSVPAESSALLRSIWQALRERHPPPLVTAQWICIQLVHIQRPYAFKLRRKVLIYSFYFSLTLSLLNCFMLYKVKEKEKM